MQRRVVGLPLVGAGGSEGDLRRSARTRSRCPDAIANANRCGSGDAYRSLDRTSGDSALFVLLTDRGEQRGAGVAGERRGADRAAARRRGTRGGSGRWAMGWRDTLLSCLVAMAESDRVAFTCNGEPVEVDADAR